MAKRIAGESEAEISLDDLVINEEVKWYTDGLSLEDEDEPMDILTCVYYQGDYYDDEGNIVTKSVYESICGKVNPNTGSFISIATLCVLIITGIIGYILVKKKHLFNKI